MYTILDLLSKFIQLAHKRRDTYIKLLENTPDPRLRILIQVMISRVEQDIAFYQKAGSDIVGEIDFIDFTIYDTLASLINQFGRTILPVKAKTKKEFIQTVIDAEQAGYALLSDLQGRLAQAEGHTESLTYVTLSKLILHKRFRIQELEAYKE